MVRNPGGAYFRICFSFERLRLTFIPPALYLVRQIYGKELKRCRFLKGKFNKNGRLLLILTSKVATFHRRKACAHVKRLNHQARLTLERAFQQAGTGRERHEKKLWQTYRICTEQLRYTGKLKNK